MTPGHPYWALDFAFSAVRLAIIVIVTILPPYNEYQLCLFQGVVLRNVLWLW